MLWLTGVFRTGTRTGRACTRRGSRGRGGCGWFVGEVCGVSEPRRVDDGCSYEVRRHPAMGQRPGEGFLDGAISLGGKLPVDRDLQPGDELRAQGDAGVSASAAWPSFFRVVGGPPRWPERRELHRYLHLLPVAAASCGTEALFVPWCRVDSLLPTRDAVHLGDEATVARHTPARLASPGGAGRPMVWSSATPRAARRSWTPRQ